MEALAVERQLAFMDNKPGVDGALAHGVHDLVEGHDDGLEIGLEKAEREKGAGQLARDGDALAL